MLLLAAYTYTGWHRAHRVAHPPPVHAGRFLCRLADDAERKSGWGCAGAGNYVCEWATVCNAAARRHAFAARADSARRWQRRAAVSVRFSGRRLTLNPWIKPLT